MSQEYPTFSSSDTFPTFTSLFFGFLVHVFFSSFLPSTSTPSQLLRKFSSCMAWFSLSKSTYIFSGHSSSVVQHSVFGDAQTFFCAIKPPTSHSPAAFCTLSWSLFFFALQFSILSHFWQQPFPRRALGFVFKYSHTLSCPFLQVCIGSSILLPASAGHNPNTFCTRLTPLHVGPLFSPYHAVQSAFYSIFSACVWSPLATTLDLHMFLAFSCVFCFFRILHTDVGLLPHTTSCDAFLLPLFDLPRFTSLLALV